MRWLHDKIVLASSALIILSILLPLLSSGKTSDKIDKSHIRKIEGEIRSDFNYKVEELRQELIKVKNELHTLSGKSQNVFFTVLNSHNNDDFWISIRGASNKIAAWNKSYRPIHAHEKNFTSIFFGEPFIEDNELYTLLSMKSVFTRNDKNYTLEVSKVLEKKFSLHNKYARDISFTKDLEEELTVGIFIAYKKGEQVPPYLAAFKLENIKGENFVPTFYILKISNSLSSSFLFGMFFFLLGGILLTIRFYRITKNLPYENSLYVYAGTLLLLFRLLIYYIFFDFSSIKGALTNPANFSSSFAWGLCATPISLLMTTLVALVFSIFLLQYLFSKDFRQMLASLSGKRRLLFGIFAIIVFLLVIRSFGASMRSMLFDSNIKLFNPQLSLFNGITLFHLFTILLISLTFLLLLFAIQLLIYRIAELSFPLRKRLNSVIFTFLIFVIVLLFHFLEHSPQSSISVKLILIFFLGHIIYWGYFSKLNLIRSSFILLIAASFFSTIILQRQNKDLENALLKLISDKLASPNTFYFEELARTAANEISEKLHYVDSPINRRKAFNLWSNSFLPRETYSSFISIKNDKDQAGSFYYNWNNNPESEKIGNRKNRALVSIPVKISDKQYLIKTGISWSNENIFSPEEPEFFITRKLAINSYLPAKNFLLFIFRNGKVVYNSHNISISKNLAAQMLNLAHKENHKTFDIKINDRKYICYPIFKNEQGNKITAIYTKEALTPLTSVFENLKIFFTQFVFSILLLLLLFILTKRNLKFRFTFSSALFILLLLTSIVPMILLAGYFRDLSDSKNLNSTSYKLRKRAIQIEKYLENHSTEKHIKDVISNAKKDLKIEFSIYSKGRLLGSSHKRFFECGIISPLLNPEIVNFISQSGLSEKLIKENIERYTFNSFYKTANIGGRQIVIAVNDAFNPILLPMSERELDVVLITIYSFAFIVIILLGLFLISRITKPLKLLVEGTQKISHGDLDYNLEIKTFGELDDLINGFNMMSGKLKVSQEKLIAAEREAAWREMAKQVAHEIKNPLTPMKLSVQQLIAAYRDNSPKFPEYFEKVTSSLLSQTKLLSNIASEFSAFGKMPKINLQRINPLEILTELKPVFTDSDFSISVISPSKPIFINSDKEYLGRVLVNFIRNAKESGAKNIEFLFSESEENIILEIKNNGAKIPDEIKEKIFERSFTTKPDGMGIGLYLSKRFLEQSGGSVTLLRSDNNETIFKLTFVKG